MGNRIFKPTLCPSKKQPSFTSPEEMEKWVRENAPMMKIVHVARCLACNGWHAKTEERPK